MYIKTSELRQLDVVNLEDGRIIGNVCDVDVDPETGQLRCLILDRPGNTWLRFLRTEDIEVAWEDIVIIGVDVIIVSVKNNHHYKYRTWHRSRF